MDKHICDSGALSVAMSTMSACVGLELKRLPSLSGATVQQRQQITTEQLLFFIVHLPQEFAFLNIVCSEVFFYD